MNTTMQALIHLDKICAVNFAPFSPRGSFHAPKAKESLRLMKERTAANFVIFTPNGLMDTPNSEKIDFNSVRDLSSSGICGHLPYLRS